MSNNWRGPVGRYAIARADGLGLRMRDLLVALKEDRRFSRSIPVSKGN